MELGEKETDEKLEERLKGIAINQVNETFEFFRITFFHIAKWSKCKKSWVGGLGKSPWDVWIPDGKMDCQLGTSAFCIYRLLKRYYTELRTIIRYTGTPTTTGVLGRRELLNQGHGGFYLIHSFYKKYNFS